MASRPSRCSPAALRHPRKTTRPQRVGPSLGEQIQPHPGGLGWRRTWAHLGSGADGSPQPHLALGLKLPASNVNEGMFLENLQRLAERPRRSVRRGLSPERTQSLAGAVHRHTRVHTRTDTHTQRNDPENPCNRPAQPRRCGSRGHTGSVQGRQGRMQQAGERLRQGAPPKGPNGSTGQGGGQWRGTQRVQGGNGEGGGSMPGPNPGAMGAVDNTQPSHMCPHCAGAPHRASQRPQVQGIHVPVLRGEAS